MRLHPIPALILVVPAAAQDPFEVPPELKDFAVRAAQLRYGSRAKLQAILEACFLPPERGGLGITYDNAYTRTVAEVWRDRKANCLSMTAFCVASCQAAGVSAQYAEALNTNHWRREGGLVRFERHVVALVRFQGMDDLVADFLPRARQKVGAYVVSILPARRMRALFHSNRAVELLGEGRSAEALAQVEASLKVDPEMSVGWNIRGVILRAAGDQAGAEQSYRRALLCDAKDSAAMGNLETLMREVGRVDEAERLRERGLQVRRRDPYYNAFLAEEALQGERLEEAKGFARTALRIQPYEAEFHLLMARIHLALGEPDDALKDLERAKRWAIPAERQRYDSKLSALRQQQEGKAAAKP